MIIPSIDIMGGRAVQLRRGRELVLTDPRDPVELARVFNRYGPLAVVDLDAAMGLGENTELVARCCRVAECRVGGGIRTQEQVRNWIRRGAARVMIGTQATPEFLRQFPRDWMIACLDAEGRDVVVEGWTKKTGADVLEKALALEPFCGEFLFTQVQMEGMLGGFDGETARQLRQAVNIPITIAGGITTVDHVRALEDLGCHSQVGRALYEHKLDLADVWAGVVRFTEQPAPRGTSSQPVECDTGSQPAECGTGSDPAKCGTGFQPVECGTGFQPVECGTGFQPVECGTGFQPVQPGTSSPPMPPLVPTLVQDARSGQVLMFAYSSAESLREALTTGRGVYWSRSRNELWRKGDTSGHVQELVAARWDCDRDAVLFRVHQTGPACHRNVASCFDTESGDVLGALERTLQRRRSEPASQSYTARLIHDSALLAGKLREETEEVIEATERAHIIWECADVLYHLMARMQAAGVTLADVESELRARFKPDSKQPSSDAVFRSPSPEPRP